VNFFFQIFVVLNALQREKYKINHISKTKNSTKEIISAKKMIVRSIPIFSVNLTNFEENLIFCASFYTPITQKLNIGKI